jgi:hypothetical protein
MPNNPGPVDTCGGCKFWFESPKFADLADRYGQCRVAPPSIPNGPFVPEGRICGYALTVADTPRCPLFIPRSQEQ